MGGEEASILQGLSAPCFSFGVFYFSFTDNSKLRTGFYQNVPSHTPGRREEEGLFLPVELKGIEASLQSLKALLLLHLLRSQGRTEYNFKAFILRL